MAFPTPTRTDHIRCDGISISYGDRRVLTGLDLVIGDSGCTGIIGENGAGKSTLLRIIAGEEEPDAGTVRRPLRTGFLWQEVQYRPDETLETMLEGAMAEIRAVERELELAASAITDDAGAERRYSFALDAAERAEVWSVGSRRDELLDGLGVAGIPFDRRLDEISGGQRSRFALAALLLQRPTALLLDEPTNHLDDRAAEFLRTQLNGWNGPVVFASHDRAFLDEVATTIIDIDPSRTGARRHGGGYSDYLAEKAAERARWEAQFANEQDELNALRYAVDVTSRSVAPNRAARDNDKMGYDFKTGRIAKQVSRRVRNAKERLDELAAEQVRKPPAILDFAGIPYGATARSDEGALVQLSHGSVGTRLVDATLAIDPATTLLITGDNGAGKSTLLSVLAGSLPLTSGSISRRKSVRIGFLEQDARFADPSATPRALYEAAMGAKRAENLPLSSLGLVAPRDIDRPSGSLSLGQQRRLALALIIAKPPHVFLLDEPTNHLSLTLATELEEALGSYPGAVVIASHDRWLRRRWSGEHLRMSAGMLSR